MDTVLNTLLKNFKNKIKKGFSTLNGIKIEIPKVKLKSASKANVNSAFLFLAIILVFSLGFFGGNFFANQPRGESNSLVNQIKNFILNKGFEQATTSLTSFVEEYQPQTSQEEAIIKVVKEASPAVVSVVISKDVPVYEQYVETQPFGDFFQFQVPKTRQIGTEKQIIGSGTGFIVSRDGMVITNKHVISEKDAYYQVVTAEGKKYPAEVLATVPSISASNLITGVEVIQSALAASRINARR